MQAVEVPIKSKEKLICDAPVLFAPVLLVVALAGPLRRVEESVQSEGIQLLFLKLNGTGPTHAGPLCSAELLVRHKASVLPGQKNK